MAKRPLLVAGIVALLFLLLPMSTTAAGEVNFFLGQKMLDDGDWKPFEDQTEFGAAFTFGGDWPVSLAVDILVSEDDSSISYYGYTVTGRTTELNVGVRKMFGERKVQPYVGGGLAFIDAEISAGGGGLSDSDIGLWANAGLLFRIGKRFNLGIDVRYSDAEVTIAGFDIDAGGTHYGALIGFRWGGS